MWYVTLIDLPMLMVGDGLHPESVEAVLDPGFTGVWICGCWSGSGVVLVPKATGAGLEFGTMGAALKTGPKGTGPVPGASWGEGCGASLALGQAWSLNCRGRFFLNS